MSKHPTPRRWRTSQSRQKRAQELRCGQTGTEALLWQQLRGRGLAGYKFRRQHPIGRFIVDFCCVERRLVVEVDGPVHAEQAEYDSARTEALVLAGYKVVRFTNEQVTKELQLTLDTLPGLLTRDSP